MSRHRPGLIILALLVLILSACAKQGDPAKVIEDYLKAKVAADADKMAGLSCKDWEAQVQQEAAPFASVKAELQDMSCKKSGKDGDVTLVSCEGKIVVAYRGENREFNLNENTYRAVEQDGEWKMCGQQ